MLEESEQVGIARQFVKAEARSGREKKRVWTGHTVWNERQFVQHLVEGGTEVAGSAALRLCQVASLETRLRMFLGRVCCDIYLIQPCKDAGKQENK